MLLSSLDLFKKRTHSGLFSRYLSTLCFILIENGFVGANIVIRRVFFLIHLETTEGIVALIDLSLNKLSDFHMIKMNLTALLADKRNQKVADQLEDNFSELSDFFAFGIHLALDKIEQIIDSVCVR